MLKIEKQVDLAWPYYAAILENGKFVIFQKVNVEGYTPRSICGFMPDDAQKIVTLLTEGGLTKRAVDFAETCRQNNHFYVDGSCAHCGSKDPQNH